MAKIIKKTTVKKVSKPVKNSKKNVAKAVKVKKVSLKKASIKKKSNTSKKPTTKKVKSEKASKKKNSLKKTSTKKAIKKKSITSKKPTTKKVKPEKVSKKKSVKKSNTKKDSNPKETLVNDVAQKEVSPLEKEILLILSKNHEGIIQTEIYEKLDASKKNRTTTILAKMSKDGTVRRERKGRSFLVFVI